LRSAPRARGSNFPEAKSSVSAPCSYSPGRAGAQSLRAAKDRDIEPVLLRPAWLLRLARHFPPANIAPTEAGCKVDPVNRGIGTGLCLGNILPRSSDVEDAPAGGDDRAVRTRRPGVENAHTPRFSLSDAADHAAFFSGSRIAAGCHHHRECIVVRKGGRGRACEVPRRGGVE